MRALLGRLILVGGFFPFISLSISCHSLLACRVSVEKYADSLIGVPLYVICFFSIAAFKIFYLSLVLVSLINMCLRVFLLGFILYGTHCASWIWVSVSFPILGNFSAIISWNIFSVPFSLSSASGTPIMQMLVHVMLFQSSHGLPPFLFNLFFLFCSSSVISTSLSSISLIHFSAFCILLLFPLMWIFLFQLLCFSSLLA